MTTTESEMTYVALYIYFIQREDPASPSRARSPSVGLHRRYKRYLNKLRPEKETEDKW
jgi:hypothetical protein